MNDPIKNRFEFVYLFDVENGNPNGDPDAGNMPRTDPETSFGLVTDVCLKRKVRNYVEMVKRDQSPFEIYVKEKAILERMHRRAHQQVGFREGEKRGRGLAEDIEKARRWMCQNFYDVRTFGAVMATEINCGAVRGPVQLGFARSHEPIVPQEVTITRIAVATEREYEQTGEARTMGRKYIVPYALYRAEGYVSAALAEKTGFSDEDLELFWEALINMFDHDRSAARGKMSARKLIVFKHDSPLGNAPAHKLFELVSVERKTNEGKPARAFSDYELVVDREHLPKGVSLEEKI